MIAALHVSAIMAITHAVDAISVPLSGSIIQRTQLRWGQFRSWLVIPPILTCVFFTLTFTNLPLSYNYKMVYLAVAYMIAHVSLNFAFNGHLGLISVLSKNVKDRLRLSSRNVQWGMFSQIIFSLVVIKMLLLPLRERTGDTMGFFYTVLIMAIVQIFGYWFLFYQTRNYDKFDPNKKITASNKLSIWEMITQIFGNKELLLLIIADCAVNLTIFSLSTFAPYYFTYVTGDEGWMGTYTLALGIATFASTIIGPYVANWVGKKNTYIFAGIYGVAGYLVLRLFGASNPVVFTAIVCIATLGAGLSAPLRHAMYMDTAEYGYFKSGKDASAFVVSMFTLPVKIGIFLATTVATYGLHLIGFDPNMVVTDQFIGRLMDLICYIPAACCVIAFAVMAFYKLTEENIAIYMEANAKKRAEEQAE